jgi:hypothetical protein
MDMAIVAIASSATEQVFSMSQPPCAAKTLLYRAATIAVNVSSAPLGPEHWLAELSAWPWLGLWPPSCEWRRVCNPQSYEPPSFGGMIGVGQSKRLSIASTGRFRESQNRESQNQDRDANSKIRMTFPNPHCAKFPRHLSKSPAASRCWPRSSAPRPKSNRQPVDGRSRRKRVLARCHRDDEARTIVFDGPRGREVAFGHPNHPK